MIIDKKCKKVKKNEKLIEKVNKNRRLSKGVMI